MLYKHPIAILGGTFDPIHNGHLKIAQALLKKLNLQSVHFIPNRSSPHRSLPIASDHDRLTMTRIAVARYHDFVVNDIEIARPKPSYTIDTLTTMRSLIPDQPLCLVMGLDQFLHFNEWYLWEKIAELTHIVVVNRPGFRLSKPDWMEKFTKKYQTEHRKDLGMTPGGRTIFVDITPIYISATEIRHKIRHHEDVSTIIPLEVFNYIKEHRLYV